MEADFVGEKYIQGRSEPMNVLGYSFKKEPRLCLDERIDGKRADAFIESTRRFFKRFETPDVIKVDNAAAMIGSGSGKRNLSRVMQFLLKNKVHPVFSVPRQPFTQASIEGNNSVFSRKFWNREIFESVEHMEKRLEVFNESSRQYLGYGAPEDSEESDEEDAVDGGPFEMTIYFARHVREHEASGKGTIDVLNESIELPKAYIQYFVLAEWDLTEETLRIRFKNIPVVIEEDSCHEGTFELVDRLSCQNEGEITFVPLMNQKDRECSLSLEYYERALLSCTGAPARVEPTRSIAQLEDRLESMPEIDLLIFSLSDRQFSQEGSGLGSLVSVGANQSVSVLRLKSPEMTRFETKPLVPAG